MITLNNFQQQIPEFQLQKGQDYFSEGRVNNLRQSSPGTWEAIVDGSDAYDVELVFKGEELTETSCNCPHDHSYCKHVVATLFALFEETDEETMNVESMNVNSKKRGKKKPKQRSFPELLGKVNEKDLHEFVIDYARRDRDFRNLFFVRFSSLFETDDELKFASIVERLIDSYGGRRGFIDYYQSINLARAIDVLLQQAEGMLAQKNYLDAFLLATAVIPAVHRLLNNADDSSGDLQSCLNRSFELLEEIVSSDAGYDLKEKIFQTSLEEAGKEEYESFDFYDSWFHLLLKSADSEERLSGILELTEKKLKDDKGTESEWRQLSFLKNKIKVLALLHRQDKARNVLLKNLHHYEFRLQYVEELKAEKKFDEAIKLIEDAIAFDAKDGKGINSRWSQQLLKIYQSKDDKENIRRVALELFNSSNFEMEYYKVLKATYDEKKWKKESGKIIRSMTDRREHGVPVYALAEVYIEEKYFDRLMALVQKNRNLEFAQRYFNVLRDKFPAELIDAYREAIRRYAEHNLGREHYMYVRDVLKNLQGIPGGKEMVHSLTIELKVKYRQRSAMVAELNKVVL